MQLVIASRSGVPLSLHFDSTLCVMSLMTRQTSVVVDVTMLLPTVGGGHMISQQKKPMLITPDKASEVHVFDDDGTQLFEHVF